MWQLEWREVTLEKKRFTRQLCKSKAQDESPLGTEYWQWLGEVDEFEKYKQKDLKMH